MEVSSGEHLIRPGKDQGVVRHRVGFDQQRGSRLGDQIQAGAHDLRLATQGVGVLHALAGPVRFADLAPAEEVAIDRSDALLAGMTA